MVKLLFAAAVALVALASTQQALGCSCPLRHPQQHYCEADFVANVKVRRVFTLPDGQTVLRIRVRRIFKSSPKAVLALSKHLVYTIPGTCGVNVTRRAMYVITGDIQAGKPWTSACHMAAQWSTLAPKTKKGFRKLYKTGCDCPIMSCHWWERQCPTASFFCSWRTSTHSDDCQAKHGVCLRQASGGCGWLGGRKYRGCMKQWREERAGALTPTQLETGATGHDIGDIISNVVVDIEPGLADGTTYSFGPSVVSSRFHKPRKIRPTSRHHTARRRWNHNQINKQKTPSSARRNRLRDKLNRMNGSTRIGYTVNGPKPKRYYASGRVNTEHDASFQIESKTHDEAEFTNEIEPVVNAETESLLSNVYHRRRYPEYTTKIGFIPDR